MSTSVFLPSASDAERAHSPLTSRRHNEQGATPGRRTRVRGPRNLPHLALGALLVVVCGTGFAVATSRLDHRHAVLALSHPVAVGDVLTASDLHDAYVDSGSGVDSIPASELNSVAGRTMAVSLPAGALLTRSELGGPTIPVAGTAIAAELVKAGSFPPDLAAGDHVLLIATPASGASAAPIEGLSTSGQPSPSSWPAIVTAVETLDNDQGTVLTVQIAASDATALAQVPAGDLDVISVAAGGS